jgi:hypothetical protein
MGLVEAAWIAVVGTLGGVIVTAVVGLLGTLITLRNQRAVMESQIGAQAAQKLRDDRKEAFVEYLSAYRQMWEYINRVVCDDEFKSEAESASTSASIKRFAFIFPEIDARLGRAYFMVQILAGEGARRATKTANETLWSMAHKAFRITESEFAELDEHASQTRNSMRAAMRADLEVQ